MSDIFQLLSEYIVSKVEFVAILFFGLIGDLISIVRLILWGKDWYWNEREQHLDEEILRTNLWWYLRTFVGSYYIENFIIFVLFVPCSDEPGLSLVWSITYVSLHIHLMSKRLSILSELSISLEWNKVKMTSFVNYIIYHNNTTHYRMIKLCL